MTEAQAQPAAADEPDKAIARDRLLEAAGGYLAAAAFEYAAVVANRADPSAMMKALAAQQRAFVAATQAQIEAAQLAVSIAAEVEDIDTSWMAG